MIDIGHTANGDIDLQAGDILYAESTGQHQRDILLADKGHYKESPETGVGALEYMNDNEPDRLLRSIRKEFTRDGMKVSKVSLDNVVAEYEESDG